jgi:hypothetical protein
LLRDLGTAPVIEARPPVTELSHDLLCLRSGDLITSERIIKVGHGPIICMPLTVILKEFTYGSDTINIPNPDQM